MIDHIGELKRTLTFSARMTTFGTQTLEAYNEIRNSRCRGRRRFSGARLAEAGETCLSWRVAHTWKRCQHRASDRKRERRAHIHPAQVSEDPAEVGPVDYVLFAVKLFQTEETAEFAKPLVGPNTTLVALQNGVECANVLSAVHGKERSSTVRAISQPLSQSPV